MNAVDLIIPAGDDRLCLRGRGGEAVESMQAFGALLGCETFPAAGDVTPDCELITPGGESGEVIYEMRHYRLFRRAGVLGIARRETPVYSGDYRPLEWRRMLAIAGVKAALDGRKIALLHGALLGEPLDGTLLFGQSGIGKSTSMRRYQAAGGRGLADDEVLIGQSGGGVVTRPLPTWKGFRYAPGLYSEPLRPAVRLLCLTRAPEAEEESVKLIERNLFLGHLYAALMFHVQYILKEFPHAEARRGAGSIWQMTESLTDRYSPRALFARLDADLITTLERS